jgi:hypothetical protein
MPAIVTYYPETEASLAEAVGSVLSKLEQVAVGLWPAWLPGAERLDGTGGAGIAAARAGNGDGCRYRPFRALSRRSG